MRWLLRSEYEKSLYFFFQAEDGIRDIGVTGVQTCALPIFDGVRERLGSVGVPVDRRFNRAWQEYLDVRNQVTVAQSVVLGRSEERRVGKECRSRWPAYH